MQVILRWHWQRNVVAIPGPSNPAHIAENHDIFDFELTGAEIEMIRGLNEHLRVASIPEDIAGSF